MTLLCCLYKHHKTKLCMTLCVGFTKNLLVCKWKNAFAFTFTSPFTCISQPKSAFNNLALITLADVILYTLIPLVNVCAL